MRLLTRAWAAIRRLPDRLPDPLGPPPAPRETEGSRELYRALAEIEPTRRALRAKIAEPLPPYPTRNALGNAFAGREEPS